MFPRPEKMVPVPGLFAAGVLLLDWGPHGKQSNSSARNLCDCPTSDWLETARVRAGKSEAGDGKMPHRSKRLKRFRARKVSIFE